MAMSKRQFPGDFLWGAATSAQQIEGGFNEGGRGESIWDRFAATSGNIEDGSDSRIACDHFHRWREDLELLKWLGVDAYRFSIAWPRIMPNGDTKVNERGLDFYDALVDGLLEANIRPFVTLYHWDLPQALQKKGGWAARSTADAFADYAAVVSKKLGDRVTDWITHNEPMCAALIGYEEGAHAPGHTDPAESLRASHHILLSHGLATRVIRQQWPDSEIGIALNVTPAHPATDSAVDGDAARWFDGLFNRWYLDPLFRGEYPEDAIADRVRRGHLSGSDLPYVQAGDLDVISTPIDFLGMNYYSRKVMRAGDDGEPIAVHAVPENQLTDMGWEVFPRGLRDELVRLTNDYGAPKIYVTENGAAYSDGPGPDGRIRDARRIDYMRSHLAAAHQAISDDVPVSGYFAWSLLDNFEWGFGYTKRFGLYWVDYATQERKAKDSAAWYREVISRHSVDDGVQIPS